MKASGLVIIRSANHLIEVYKYENPVYYEIEMSEDRKEKIKESKTGEKAERTDEYQQRKIALARNHIRRLALANFSDNSSFISLTFADSKNFDITNIKKCNARLQRFIKKLQQRHDDLKYLFVLEFQERGAVHYHGLINITIDEDRLRELWTYGKQVDVQSVTDIDNVGAYIVKYMAKNASDERLKGHRLYLKGRNLEKPKHYRGRDALLMLEVYIDENGCKLPVFESEYYSEYTGQVKYQEFNSRRLNNGLSKV